MAVEVVTEIEIARPRADVAAYASDPDRATEWYENIVQVEWQTEKPLRFGSRVAFVARFLGRTMSYTYEVTELVPAERLVMSNATMETFYEWRDTPEGGTHMTLRNRGSAPRLMAPFMRRANEKDLARLKAILETG